MKQKTILVADDQLGLLTGLIGKLKKKYTVLTAVNGAAAVEAIKNNALDFVVLDNYMYPGPEGVEIAKQLQFEKPELPVVVYSSGAPASFVMEKDGIKMCYKPDGENSLINYIKDTFAGE